MSEDIKKVEPNEEEPKATELSDKDLEQVAGGGSAASANSNWLKIDNKVGS